MERDDEVLERFGRRIGRQLAQGGQLVRRLRQEIFSTSRGNYEGVDGIVLVRDPDELKGEDKSTQDRFESALIDAAQDTDVEVVGVENSDTEPSQVSWFSDQGVTSVDCIDLIEGKTALVYALLGARGQVRREGLGRAAAPSAPGAPGDQEVARCAGSALPLRWRWPPCSRRPCSRACRRRASCARTTGAWCCPRPPGC